MSADENSPAADPTPGNEEWIRSHRQQRAAEKAQAEAGDGLDVPRMNLGWMPSNPAARRAVETLQDPDELRRVQAEIAADQAVDRAQVLALRARNRFESYRSNRPSMFATASITDLDPKDNGQARIRGWWNSGTKNLVIAGLPGRGKTHGAWAVCNEIAAADRDGKVPLPVAVRGYQVAQIRDLLQPPAAHLARDEVQSGRRAREAAELQTCDLLLIDDLTSAKVTDWFRETMHKIIDSRVTADLRTIVTVNVSARDTLGKELVQQLGEAIVSRLKDDSVFVWLDGVDRREFSTWDPFADE